MRIVISSEGTTIDSTVDPRFGRCSYFLIVETENKDIKQVSYVENQGAQHSHGAGIKAGQQIGELNPDVIITGNVGPKAADMLGQLEIPVYQGAGTIKEAVEKFLNSKTEKVTVPSAPYQEAKIVKSVSKEKIYFPLLENKGMDSRISEHFGHAPFFGLYDFSTGKLTIAENNLDHTNPNKSPIDQIVEACTPTTIFALGIGERAISLIKEKGLSLKTGEFETVKEALENLDNLQDQTKDCGHKH